jgi:hypothetical protein
MPLPSEDGPREPHADDSGDQGADQNLLAAKAGFHVEKMPQQTGNQYRSAENAKEVAHFDLGRIHCSKVALEIGSSKTTHSGNCENFARRPASIEHG